MGASSASPTDGPHSSPDCHSQPGLAQATWERGGSFSASPIKVSRLIFRRMTTEPVASSPARLQTFLPRSTPRTAISIPCPSFWTTGEPTAPEGGASHSINILKPHLKQQWVIAPHASPGFVANMEDVLEVYQRPHDPHYPVVCLDETTKQMIAETRAPISPVAGAGAKGASRLRIRAQWRSQPVHDVRPLEGWRRVEVTDRHAAVDYARVLKALSDDHFPDATKIVLVQDNLSAHTPASLYAAFPAGEARRLAERFEWHYPPKHGSWLDLAEAELAVLATQCLDRRIPDKATLIAEVAARQRDRNWRYVKADWQFTAADARTKLKSLYPQFE